MECIYHHKFIDRESAKLEVFRYIEGFYHTKRIHSAIGYKTPNQMESFYHSKQKLAAYKVSTFKLQFHRYHAHKKEVQRFF
ncbi:IS3 family transposase [Sphingobacterium sp. JUb20]|uniref:IS3 family transposase n=1 Tax=Sphingobacterium sp. JUb20 TaxID=2485110 RepID=UPI00397A7F7E